MRKCRAFYEPNVLVGLFSRGVHAPSPKQPKKLRSRGDLREDSYVLQFLDTLLFHLE